MSLFEQLFDVWLKTQGKHYECPSSDSVLQAGLRHGLAMRYECNNGSCGSCKAKLIKGQIKKNKHHDFFQLAGTEFLMCCHSPSSDIEIELDLINDVGSIAPQTIDAKIKKITFINDNFAIVTLKTPRSRTLQFMAGQSINVSFQGLTSSYPLASCPCQGMLLELHIRNVATDFLAVAIFNRLLTTKMSITIQGPQGVFVLKEKSTRPMVFIAWDNGFAPIRSLVEHAFSLQMPNPVYLYWAYSATEKVPYLDNYAKSWQMMFDEYHYATVACVFNRSSKNDCYQLAKKIFDALDLTIVNRAEVYISAPAEVLIYLSELLLNNGLGESQLIASPI